MRPIVRHHHERPDGGGYPDHFVGEEIPLLARILSVVDVYDALTTERPYKPALSSDQAFHELRAEARRGWKFGDIVEAFASVAAQPGFGQPLAGTPDAPSLRSWWPSM